MTFVPLSKLRWIREAILEYVSRLAFLAEVRWNNNTLRVVIVDASWNIDRLTTLASVQTVTTVSTVSTLTNQTQIWAYIAQPHIPAQMNIEATVANIENLSIT